MVDGKNSSESRSFSEGPAFPWAMVAHLVHDIDVKVHELTGQIEATIGDARAECRQTIAELARMASDLEAKVVREADDLDVVGRLKTVADTARVQAHLAKADASDGVQELRAKLVAVVDRIAKQETRVEAESRKTLSTVRKVFSTLSERLGIVARIDAAR